MLTEASYSLNTLISRVVAIWPEHEEYIDKSFAGRPSSVMEMSELIAGCIIKLSKALPAGLDDLARDYRFLCETLVLPEELYFRRHNRYRLTTFEEAFSACYSNQPFMSRYMNGLLVSNVLWNNHAQTISTFANEYLPSISPGSDILEIGPGHGLFLYLAALSPNVSRITGWDVSPTSVSHTQNALKILGTARPAEIILQNIFDVNASGCAEKFDNIIMSEILEHLEDPVAALRAAQTYLKPGGEIWVNVPANSPAPDHIFLVRDPEHACRLVEEAGLKVVSSHAYPMTGSTLEKARKRKLAISCIVVGRKTAVVTR